MNDRLSRRGVPALAAIGFVGLILLIAEGEEGEPALRELNRR